MPKFFEKYSKEIEEFIMYLIDLLLTIFFGLADEEETESK